MTLVSQLVSCVWRELCAPFLLLSSTTASVMWPGEDVSTLGEETTGVCRNITWQCNIHLYTHFIRHCSSYHSHIVGGCSRVHWPSVVVPLSHCHFYWHLLMWNHFECLFWKWCPSHQDLCRVPPSMYMTLDKTHARVSNRVIKATCIRCRQTDSQMNRNFFHARKKYDWLACKTVSDAWLKRHHKMVM